MESSIVDTQVEVPGKLSFINIEIPFFYCYEDDCVMLVPRKIEVVLKKIHDVGSIINWIT